MYKLAVIGSRETVLACKTLGLDTYAVENADEAKRTFQKLTAPEKKYAVIYLEENLSGPLSAEIAKYTDKITPAVILIPGREGSQGLGLSALQDAVKRAIGADIL